MLCTATVEDRVPPFVKGSGLGWVTAEYGMLPRSPVAVCVVKLPPESKEGEPLKFRD